MSLELKINNDIKAAMLARDSKTLEALRAIKAALLLEKTKGGEAGGVVTEAHEVRMLQKLVKQRREAAEIYHSKGRKDLAEQEEFQATIIEKYLPAQMDPQEIKKVVQDIITQMGAQSIKDMGKVMAEATRKMSGKADNKTVAGIVKELLGG